MKAARLIVSLLFVWGTMALAGPSQREQEIQECMEHLRIIGEAIKEYKADHQEQLPNWLSELHPEYLKDAKILLCPADETGGTKISGGAVAAAKDPSLPCSYQYQFNPQQTDVSGVDFTVEIPKNDTWRKRRTRQTRYFRGQVPVVQCWNHRDIVIELNYRGEVHCSAASWENNYMSQNAVLKSLREIIKRNPRGWEQEISLTKLHSYFWHVVINRLGDLRSVLEAQQTPLSMEVLKTLGKIYEEERNAEQALKIYRQLVQSRPDDMEHRLRFAQLLAVQEKYQEAITQCQQVIQSKPDERRAYTLLAQIYAVLDESHAQARLEEILKLAAKERKASPLEGLSDDLRHNYLLRLQQSLLSKEKDLKSVVKDAQEAIKERFDQPAAPDLMTNLVGTLSKSVRKSPQWETYNTSDGLLNNYVWSIAQDSNTTMSIFSITIF